MIHYCSNRERRFEGRRIAADKHSHTEIVYYHSGISCDLTIDGKTYNAVAGCVSIAPAGVVHSEFHHSSGTVSYIQFSSSVYVPAGLYTNMRHISYLFDSIARELKHQSPFFEQMCEIYLNLLCTELLRKREDNTKEKKDLSYVKNYILENYTYNISITDLSKQICYSEDRFRHLFSETFGISPKKMITELRLKKAAEMLSNSDLSCTDIALECGFYDASQFSRMFLKKYGVSPKKVRLPK